MKQHICIYQVILSFINNLHLPNLKLLDIGEGCFNKANNDLVIENFPNLQSIIVKEKALQNLNLFSICNNEKLKTIETKEDSLVNVKNVVIESIFEMRMFYFYLPNLQSLETRKESFYKTISLSISGNSFLFLSSLYLPNLQSIKSGYYSFHETTYLSLSGNSIIY